VNEFFRKFANTTSAMVGSAWAFLIAFVIIILWGLTGPVFHFSDTWQLIINTGTTIVTFLMVFLIQNTQNRDAKAIHLKLDELIRAVKGARTGMVDLEDLSDNELEELQKEFIRLRKKHGPTMEAAVNDVDEELEERSPTSSRKTAKTESNSGRRNHDK
jgi:low affinity Fe/Cu permease